MPLVSHQYRRGKGQPTVQRRVVVVSVVIAVVVVLAGGGLLAWRAASRTPYEQAVAWMPAETLRATYTDWAAVRGLADGTDLGAASSTRDVGSFLERAYDQDLVSASAVADSTYAMNEQYGFSPVDAAWEMYGQSREGAVVVMAMTDEVDLDGVERNLRSLGYQAPAEGAGTGGTWAGSADLVATIDPSLTPVLQNVVVLPDEHVVLLSDNTSYVSSAASVVTGSAESLEDATEGTAALAELAGEPVSAMLYASDFACEALSMGSADEEDRAVAEDLVNRVGGVSPCPASCSRCSATAGSPSACTSRATSRPPTTSSRACAWPPVRRSGRAGRSRTGSAYGRGARRPGGRAGPGPRGPDPVPAQRPVPGPGPLRDLLRPGAGWLGQVVREQMAVFARADSHLLTNYRHGGPEGQPVGSSASHAR